MQDTAVLTPDARATIFLVARLHHAVRDLEDARHMAGQFASLAPHGAALDELIGRVRGLAEEVGEDR